MLVECAERPHTAFAFLVASRVRAQGSAVRESKMSPGSVFRHWRCRSNVTRDRFLNREIRMASVIKDQNVRLRRMVYMQYKRIEKYLLPEYVCVWARAALLNCSTEQLAEWFYLNRQLFRCSCLHSHIPILTRNRGDCKFGIRKNCITICLSL